MCEDCKNPCRSNKQCEILVYFLPHKSLVCEKMFQEEGISANVTIREFPLYFIPFDSDLLSLELENSYKVSSQFEYAAVLICIFLIVS